MNDQKPEAEPRFMEQVRNLLARPFVGPAMAGAIAVGGGAAAYAANMAMPDQVSAAVTGNATTELSCVTNPNNDPNALKMVQVRFILDGLAGFNDGSLQYSIKRLPTGGPEEIIQQGDFRNVLSPFRLGDGETSPPWNLEDSYTGQSTVLIDTLQGPTTYRVEHGGFPTVEATLDCNPVPVTPPPVTSTPTTPDAPPTPPVTEPLPPERLCGRIDVNGAKVTRTGRGKWTLSVTAKNTGNGTIESDGNAADRNPTKARAAAGFRAITSSRAAVTNNASVLARNGAINLDLLKDIAPGKSITLKVPFTTPASVRFPRFAVTGTVPAGKNGLNCLTATTDVVASR